MALLQTTIDKITPQDAGYRARAKARLEQLTMPHWALGKLMDLAEDLAGITRSIKPPVASKVIVTMAGDHGVVEEGVSAFPQEVTPQMVYNIASGGAGVNALARNSATHVAVVDMGVAASLDDLVASGRIIDRKIRGGTDNMAKGPAMSREEAVRSVEAGIGVALQLAPSTDVFGTGEMGIGNTTPSTAICAVLTGKSADEITGRGTGINDETFAHKIGVINRALELNRPDSSDGLDVLAKVGGFEIGGLAGLILGAASLRKPVVIDGFISTAAALIAQSLCPVATEYMIAAHSSVEVGHDAMLDKLGKSALLDLNFRLGEGTGAALAMHLLDASVRILTEVATFGEARVSEGQ